jgi:uncharacterized phage protein gp47/JayE
MADLYQPANADELKGQFLRDVRLAAIDAGVTDPPTTPGTDWDMTATACANLCLLGFANVNASEADNNVLTATGQALDDIRKAEGLPEVTAAGATGKLVITVSGTVTVTAGQVFTIPSGLSGTVVGTYVNPADQSEVSVAMTDVGVATNLAADEIVRFSSPPVNLAVEAKVSIGEPLTGGTEIEDDERKRDRILNVRRNRPAGGNWAHLRKIALEALGSVQDCYVYPGLGGPGSCKVVPVKDFNLDNDDFSRVLSTTALDVVRLAIQTNAPNPQEIVVTAVANESCDVTLKVAIPDSALTGGNGRGWSDAQPWPILESGETSVRISAVTAGNDGVTVTALTATAPINGQTHIAWWSQVDRKFYTALILTATGSSGAWVLTLDRPLVGKTGAGPVTGGTADYVCPASEQLDKYGAAWVKLFRDLGPGENTTDINRTPRAKRHPYVTDEDPTSLTAVVLRRLTESYPEITDHEYALRSPSSPTVPAAVATAPNVLIPRRFAIYKQ